MELLIGFLVGGIILLVCLGFGASVEQTVNCVFRCLDDRE